MTLNQTLTDKGFAITDAEKSDFDVYYAISRLCYEKYVDEYFGGWVEDVQLAMNSSSFDEHIAQTVFKKILLHDKVVGFFAYNDLNDKIDGVSIQMTEEARGNGIGSYYLEHIISIANHGRKPIFLQVFKSNPARNLYERYGFVTYDVSVSHYQMRYDPSSLV